MRSCEIELLIIPRIDFLLSATGRSRVGILKKILEGRKPACDSWKRMIISLLGSLLCRQITHFLRNPLCVAILSSSHKLVPAVLSSLFFLYWEWNVVSCHLSIYDSPFRLWDKRENSHEWVFILSSFHHWHEIGIRSIMESLYSDLLLW